MKTDLEAALFDLDGLLVDSEPLWHEAEIRVLGSYGVPLTVEMCRQTKGRYVSEAVKHWHDRYPWDPPDFDKVVAEILEALDELVSTRLDLKPGVQHAINECTLRGLRLAVASSSPLRIISAALARFGLGEVFEAACSAEHEIAGKPDPAVFLTAAQLLDVSPGACVVFEDSVAGICAAKRAGMLCVAVPEVRASGDEEGLAVADVVLGSLEELDERVWARLEIRPGTSVRAVRRHPKAQRPPIAVVPGDELTVSERDDQWPAFVLVTTSSGLQGWVPRLNLTRTGERHRGLYTARRRYDTTELPVEPGAVLAVVETDLGSGWLWCSDQDRHQGWVPARCVEPLTADVASGVIDRPLGSEE
jgi:mannitol-1-/sugar-/sorbitol-6-/2-deoxyglucose-6-phosphatase